MWDPCEFFVRSRGKTVLTTWNFLKSKNIKFCSPNAYLISQSQNISPRLRQVRQSGILSRQSKTKYFKIFWALEKMLLLTKRTKELQLRVGLKVDNLRNVINQAQGFCDTVCEEDSWWYNESLECTLYKSV